MRYTTFMWNITSTNTGQLNYIRFLINGHNFNYTTDNIRNFTTFSNISLQYKVLCTGYYVTTPIYPVSTGNSTTTWLNANLNGSGETTTSYQWRSTDNSPGSINYSGKNNTNLQRIVRMPPNTYANKPLYFFVRVGIPSLSNLYFNNISMAEIL